MKIPCIIRLLLALMYYYYSTGACFAQAGNDSLSLEDCIRIALQNNPEARRMTYATQRAGTDRKEALYMALPSVQAGWGHNLSYGRRIDPATNQYYNQQFTSGNPYISGSMILFDGLANLRRIRQQATASQAAEAEEDAFREQLMLEVMLAYVQVLTARDMEAQQDRRLEVTAQQLKRTEDLHRSGAVSPADYYDLKAQLAGDENALYRIRQTYQQTLNALGKLLNVPEMASLKLQPLSLSWSPDTTALRAESLFDAASHRLPLIQAAQYRKVEALQNIRTIRSGFVPRISAGAGFESTYSSNAENSYLDQARGNIGRYVSFSLTIPLTNGFLVKNNLSRAKLALREAEDQEQARLHDLQRAVVQNLLDLETAGRSYQSFREQEQNFEASFRVAQVRFEAGDLHSALFLTAKNNYETAQSNRLMAWYALRLQELLTSYYQGSLPWYPEAPVSGQQ